VYQLIGFRRAGRPKGAKPPFSGFGEWDRENSTLEAMVSEKVVKIVENLCEGFP
jgi:hypothetical protein